MRTLALTNALAPLRFREASGVRDVLIVCRRRSRLAATHALRVLPGNMRSQRSPPLVALTRRKVPARSSGVSLVMRSSSPLFAVCA